MSSIIRHATVAPAVFIGERQRDLLQEEKAVALLGTLFPQVSYQTDADGVRTMGILEVYKFEQTLSQKVEESHRHGLQEGYQKGLEQGRDEARAVLAQFDRAIKDAVEQRAALLEEAREKILELVIQISRKVTFDAVEIDRESTVTMITRIIDQLVDRSRLKIKVHPDHLPIMEQNIDRFLVSSTAIKELTFEADPRVRYGGCFIETPSGDIDARLESAFDVISNAILGEEEKS